MRFQMLMWVCVSSAWGACATIQAEQIVTLERPQMAGISGFRAMWDRPLVLAERGATEIVDRGPNGAGPRALWSTNKIGTGRTGAIVFDALHRSLLVRFPDAAERIAAELAAGRTVAKLELVLTFRDTELWPEGYLEPAGLSFLGDTWVKQPPTWHAVAWALRKPWIADPAIGPTFNAAIHRAVYWTKYGAQDEQSDRFPTRFGPAEVSSRNIEGRLDVTAALRDVSFGATLGQRLRTLADCGFLVKKWEIYDARYALSGYEWGSATGGRGILIDAPRLVVTLAEASTPLPAAERGMPSPTDVRSLATTANGTSQPTAVMPTDDELRELVKQYGFRRPNWMPDWQWQRVEQLHELGQSWSFPTRFAGFDRWIDELLAVPPRRWTGFDAADNVAMYMRYAPAWPMYVREYAQLYWWAWLQPDKTNSQLVHPFTEIDKKLAYVERTGDWTGNASLYRAYCWNLGTMNFNHTAAAGALVGGRIIDSPLVMGDGRHGLEVFPLRTWCWFDGSTQESLDHYYFAVSLKGQKVFADFGPRRLDRMMGRSILAKSVDELAGDYHPGLRNFVACSGRTGIAYVVGGIQDGTKHIIHTLSHRGALLDLNHRQTVAGMPIVGHDATPGVIARLTLDGPWEPEFVANTVDEKPLPFEMTAAYTMWGGLGNVPLWRRTYLGHHYGLASEDVPSHAESVAVMGQWKRSEKAASSVIDLATMLVRFGVNETNLLDSLWHGTKHRNPNGVIDTRGGYTCQLQHRNKLLVLSSPLKGLSYPLTPTPPEIKSIQTTIGFMNFETPRSWSLYVDEKRIDELPVAFHAGRRITIHDGVSYVGIIPLPSTDLGRDYEVMITNQTGPLIELQGGGPARPALLIQQYNYLSDTLLPDARKNSDEVDLAYGGFAIELGDESEYGDFDRFRRHLAEARWESKWDDAERTLHVQYVSGDDKLECGYRPGYAGDWNRNIPTDQCFPYRRVNGHWPYLPQGIDRDSTLAQQGKTGRLSKHGATVVCEPGRMAYLQTEPLTGTYAAYNPFPDPTLWAMSTPDGVHVEADGRLSLVRVVVQPGESKLWVDVAARDDQHGPEMASALLVSGFKSAPHVVVNDHPLDSVRQVADRAGAAVYLVPLDDRELPDAAAILERVEDARRRLPACAP